MDLQYLLSLQAFREGAGSWLEKGLTFLSEFTISYMIVVPFILFWSVSRKKGYWFMLTLGFADFVNNVVKLSACIYRPWVRNPAIHPADAAVETATGYSFPSGHTVCATSIYGGAGVSTFRKKKWLGCIFFVLMLLTGFSRNYLGVHTPQDVFVGIFEGFLVMAAVTFVLRQCEDSEKKADLYTFAGILIALAGLAFMKWKRYPMDYVDGALLVNPADMRLDGYVSVGTFLGILCGSLFERKLVHYTPDGSVVRRVLRAVIGIVVMLLAKKYIRSWLIGLLGISRGKTLGMFIVAFMAVGLFPWCCMQVRKRFPEKV